MSDFPRYTQAIVSVHAKRFADGRAGLEGSAWAMSIRNPPKLAVFATAYFFECPCALNFIAVAHKMKATPRMIIMRSSEELMTGTWSVNHENHVVDMMSGLTALAILVVKVEMTSDSGVDFAIAH